MRPADGARAALERGEISSARILAEETLPLDDAAAAEVARAVLGGGPRRSPAEFRRAVRRAVIVADPVRAELAAQRAGAARAVSRRAFPDAQAALFVSGPAIGVQTIWTALDAVAAAEAGRDRDGNADPDGNEAGAGDGGGRTLDQRRFDALVRICERALADATGPRGRPGVPPTVYLFADLPTWVGLADHPVEVDGYGPVPAGVARAHLQTARWRALVFDAARRGVLAAGDHRYRPSAATMRALHARDRRCGFPGCAAAVWFCDADHNRPYAAGRCTDADNCGLLCRRHHRLKTFTAWAWRRTADGAIEWTDPHGHTWCRDPIRYQLPDPDPDLDPGVTPAGRDPTGRDPTPPLYRSSPGSPPVPAFDDFGDPPF